MPSPLEAKSEVTTGKHGDKGRYVTTDQGSQIFLTQDGKIGQTGKSIGGEMNWKPVGQPKPKQDWIEPGSRSGEAESDLPGESGDAKPQYESPFVQSFAESIIANIRKHEQQKQQPKPSGPNPQDHEHHISKLPIPMRQSMLNWSAEAQTLINPVAWASQGSTFGSGDPRAVKKATFDKIDKAELNRVVGSLSKLISVGDQQGVNLRPFIRHNNIIPRELAAKLKPSDLFNPVQDNERYQATQADIVVDRLIAAEMGITVEEYAARRAKNSPGQMSLFGDGLGGDTPLRTSARQQRLDWDESKVKRDTEGKFAEKAEAKADGPVEGPKEETAEERRKRLKDYWSQMAKDQESAKKAEDDKKNEEPEAEPEPEPPTEEPLTEEPKLEGDDKPEPEPEPVSESVDEYDESKSPRENAESRQKKLDEDYAFARASAIGNAGEDLKGSARHKRNEWRSLEDAESNGTAEELVTRDQLLKNEPHSLAVNIDRDPMSAIFLHQVMKSFPPKPGYGQREDKDPAKTRAEYLEAYRSVKNKAESLLASGADMKECREKMYVHVNGMIEKLRSGAYQNRYNTTANGLIGLYRNLSNYRGKLADKVNRSVSDFIKSAGEMSSDDLQEKLADVAATFMEGGSLDAALGQSKSSSKAKTFNPAELYVGIAERTGGPKSKVTSAENATSWMVDKVGIRGVQFGNSVSDEERKHHATMAADALLDLADVTGLPVESISLGGKLGLAIGARGVGNALAHYEPGTKVINLTRKKGVGSLAHEWAHAFDHEIGGGVVGRRSLLEETKTSYFSEYSGQSHSGKLVDGKWVRETKDERQKPLFKSMQSLRESWKSSGYESRLRLELREKVDNKQISAKKAAEYWMSNREVFARTFERYVQHKLESSGRKNSYLSGIETKSYKSGGLWPTDSEMEKMAPAFDALMDSHREENLGVKDRVKYSAADRASIADMIADRLIAAELGLTVEQYAARKKSQKGQQEFQWITVNADKGKGQPVMIDKKDGTIKAGMGGKFDGQKIGEIGKGGGANAGGGKDTSRGKGDGDKYGDRLESMKKRRDPGGISQQPIDRAMRGDSGKIKLPKPESKTESQKPMKKVNLIFRDKRGNTEYHDLPVEKVVDPKMFGHKVEILPGGHVRLTYKGWGIMPSEFGGIIREEVEKHFYGKKADLDKGKYGEGFWRGTNNKNEKGLLETGQMRNSKNFADGTTEKGVSVAEHVGYGATQGYKYMHRIDGEVIGTGSDGEPVLDPKTIKVRKSFSGNSLSKLFKDDHAQLDRVLENEGWDRKLFTSTSSPKLLDASEFQKHVSDNDSDGGGSEVTDSPPNTGPKNAASPSPGSKPTPAPKPAENEPPTIPGQQTSIFGGDDLNTGQKSLFNMARPSKADQRAAKRDMAPPSASLLEQIDDEEKKRLDSRKSLPGQRDMFMAQFEAAMIEQYRVAVKPKADKPEKPKAVIGNKGDRGRFITTEGGDVVFLEGKMQPDGLIDTSKAVARKKREKAKHTNPDKFVPVTDEEKAIVQAVGDKKKDVAYFKQFVDEAHKEISGRLKSDTDAMRETLAQFGYTGTKASGFLSSLQRRRDTANIPGFDEMLDYVQKHYRQLLTARPGESTGAGDEESMLFNRLKAGFPPPPKKSDQEVIDAAWGMSGIDYSGLPSEWEGETREADDEVLHGEIDDDLEDAPFAASPLAVTERYAFTFATAFKNAYRRELVTSKIMEQYQVKHAPEGGETVGGKKYKGGQFVPGDANSEKNAGNQSDDWFNKSKIVDDHGKPLLLYHGNRGESDLGSGWVSFTDNENHAAMFGEVQQMHLKMENPFDITSLGSGGDPDSSETISGKNLSDAFAEHGIQIDFGGEKRKGFTTELMFPKKAEIREKLMSAGFDGIIVTDYFEFDAPEYIVFDESQIKVIPNDDGHDDDEDEYDS